MHTMSKLCSNHPNLYRLNTNLLRQMNAGESVLISFGTRPLPRLKSLCAFWALTSVRHGAHRIATRCWTCRRTILVGALVSAGYGIGPILRVRTNPKSGSFMALEYHVNVTTHSSLGRTAQRSMWLWLTLGWFLNSTIGSIRTILPGNRQAFDGFNSLEGGVVKRLRQQVPSRGFSLAARWRFHTQPLMCIPANEVYSLDYCAAKHDRQRKR